MKLTKQQQKLKAQIESFYEKIDNDWKAAKNEMWKKFIEDLCGE